MRELRQRGDQGRGDGRADPRHALDESRQAPPPRMLADRLLEPMLEVGDLLAHPTDVDLDPTPHAPLAHPRQALPLAGLHGDQLAPAGGQGGKVGARRIGHDPGLGPHRLGKGRDHRGIDPIGLGQPAGRAGEVADLARIDHRDPMPQLRQQGRDLVLQAAGGLEHDQRRVADRTELAGQSPRTVPGGGDGEPGAAGSRQTSRRSLATSMPTQQAIEAMLSMDPTLQMRARPSARRAAQAIVRVRVGSGRVTRLTHGLRHQRSDGIPPAAQPWGGAAPTTHQSLDIARYKVLRSSTCP